MHIFVSGRLFQFAALQQAHKLPWPSRGLAAAVPGAARPTSLPEPAPVSFKLATAAAATAADVRGRPRRRRPSLWPLPSPQEAPPAATSVSALQALKFYRWGAAGSMSNNVQCCDMEKKSVPRQHDANQ